MGFLALDAALLSAAAIVGGEPVLLLWAAAFVALAGGVLLLRRRYAQRLHDIAEARRRLREELRGLRPPEPERNGP